VLANLWRLEILGHRPLDTTLAQHPTIECAKRRHMPRARGRSPPAPHLEEPSPKIEPRCFGERAALRLHEILELPEASGVGTQGVVREPPLGAAVQEKAIEIRHGLQRNSSGQSAERMSLPPSIGASARTSSIAAKR